MKERKIEIKTCQKNEKKTFDKNFQGWLWAKFV